MFQPGLYRAYVVGAELAQSGAVRLLAGISIGLNSAICVLALVALFG